GEGARGEGTDLTSSRTRTSALRRVRATKEADNDRRHPRGRGPGALGAGDAAGRADGCPRGRRADGALLSAALAQARPGKLRGPGRSWIRGGRAAASRVPRWRPGR